MRTHRLILLSALASAMLACERSSGSVALDPVPQGPSRPPPGECLLETENCGTEVDLCCEGSYCDEGPYTPESGRCRAQRPDGERCGLSFQCQSGVCNSTGRCGPESCVRNGESCLEEGCCAGAFCEQNAYVPSFQHCVPKRADGEFCSWHGECVSAQCTDGVCGAPACAEAGTSCFGFEAGCCADTFCNLPADSYGPGVCAARLPQGSPCEVGDQCASDNCQENRCAALAPVGSVSFSRIYHEVLVPNGCTGGYCHGGGAGGLWFSSLEGAYRALVNTAAAGPGCSAIPRVRPGQLSASLIWAKVAPGVAAPCGEKMPPTRGALSAGSLVLLEAWILAGAPR